MIRLILSVVMMLAIMSCETLTCDLDYDQCIDEGSDDCFERRDRCIASAKGRSSEADWRW